MVQELNGTVNEWGRCKQKLGANAILAVSLAVCKVGASVKKIPLHKHITNLAGNKSLVLPVFAFNVINSGSHAGKKLVMQEFMILSVGASSFKEAMKMGVEVYHHLKVDTTFLCLPFFFDCKAHHHEALRVHCTRVMCIKRERFLLLYILYTLCKWYIRILQCI